MSLDNICKHGHGCLPAVLAFSRQVSTNNFSKYDKIEKELEAMFGITEDPKTIVKSKESFNDESIVKSNLNKEAPNNDQDNNADRSTDELKSSEVLFKNSVNSDDEKKSNQKTDSTTNIIFESLSNIESSTIPKQKTSENEDINDKKLVESNETSELAFDQEKLTNAVLEPPSNLESSIIPKKRSDKKDFNHKIVESNEILEISNKKESTNNIVNIQTSNKISDNEDFNDKLIESDEVSKTIIANQKDSSTNIVKPAKLSSYIESKIPKKILSDKKPKHLW